LAELGQEESTLRARVSVNLAETLMPVSTPGQLAVMLDETLAMARRVNDPIVLFHALYLKVRGDRRPELSAARMGMLDEMLALADRLGSYEMSYEHQAFRVLEHLERGDLEQFVADERRLLAPLARKIRQPFYDQFGYNYLVLMAMLAGRFEEAEHLVQQGLKAGQQMLVDNFAGVASMQMFTIRREQGRLQEMAPLVRLILSQNPGAAVWRPGLALLCAELDLRPEATAAFEALAANRFADLPRDALWVTGLVYLSEVCAYLGDADRARILYDLLRSYDGRNVVVGFKSFCLGAAARYLGLLATTMADWPAAEGHFEDALAMNERMGAIPLLAHTRTDFAAMLLTRGGEGDGARAEALLAAALETAEELGMQTLVRRIGVLRESGNVS
jgi:tetratricopeptide (TPR) repeat protein